MTIDKDKLQECSIKLQDLDFSLLSQSSQDKGSFGLL